MWLFFFAITFLISVSIYAPNLGGAFILDDYPNLSPLQNILNPNKIDDLVEFISINNSGQLGRYISLLSFALQANDWPHNPVPFKSVNLVIHLINGCLIAFITHCLLKKQHKKQPNLALYMILITGAWLIHPIHVSTVLYTVQRMTLLMAFFTLLTLSGYLAGRELCFKSLPKGYVICTFTLIIGGICAVFSKENGVLIVLYIAVIEYTILNSSTQPKYWRHWLYVFIYTPIIIGILFALYHIPHYIQAHNTRAYTLNEHLLTEARVLLSYINKILLPKPDAFGLFFDDYIISKNLFDPFSTFFSVLTLTLLIALALFCRKKYVIFSFSFLWFIAGHSLESSIIPLELYFDHRNYLPSFGLIFGLLILISYTYKYCPTKSIKYIILTVFTSYFLLTYFISFREASIWSNQKKQAFIWHKNHPNSKRANAFAAQAWLDLNKPIKADELLKSIPLIDVQDSASYILRLKINCHTQHLHPTQLNNFLIKLKSTKTENATVQSLKEIVILWGNKKCLALSDAYLEKLLISSFNNTSPGILKSHLTNTISLFYAFNNQYDKAFSILEKGIKLMPKAKELVLLKIRWVIANKQYIEALSLIKEAQQFKVNTPKDYYFKVRLNNMEKDIAILLNK